LKPDALRKSISLLGGFNQMVSGFKSPLTPFLDGIITYGPFKAARSAADITRAVYLEADMAK